MGWNFLTILVKGCELHVRYCYALEKLDEKLILNGNLRVGFDDNLHCLALWCQIWRWEWDSNPRYASTYAGFQDQYFKPLSHPTYKEHIAHSYSFVNTSLQSVLITLYLAPDAAVCNKIRAKASLREIQ